MFIIVYSTNCRFHSINIIFFQDSNAYKLFKSDYNKLVGLKIKLKLKIVEWVYVHRNGVWLLDVGIDIVAHRRKRNRCDVAHSI